MKNIFCSISDLKNEAAVEAFFIDRLLVHLGFEDAEIARKESISEYAIGKGGKKLLYKPDYVIKPKSIPALVIDAKAPSEDIFEWVLQCSSYCLEINKEFDYNPVEYYILSNGSQTALFKWDQKEPVLELDFSDFEDGSKKLCSLIEFVGRAALVEQGEKTAEKLGDSQFKFQKITLPALASKFQKIHQEIWQSEKKGPAAAFHELIKLFFVKIRKDKDIHRKLGKDPKPKYKDVSFSQHWISHQVESKNPVNEILFKNLLDELEKDIITGKKKRFFDRADQINISAGTIKKIVKEIENIDLAGMEEDIHGRMFEAFLDATIRGKDIGQFFTPRDVVNLMVRLGDPVVTKQHIDSVLDACCGSGGFLITALSHMLRKSHEIKGLSAKERAEIEDLIKTKRIFGIDAGSDPAMYKIARMNMYLHGDGGSNIFYADSLDKSIGRIGGEDVEVDGQIDELRDLIAKSNKKFDLILSNPPFSLQYSRDNKDQAEILNQYALSRDGSGGRLINKLISSVMFIERYKDLISDSGRIIAVIDDSVLSGSSFAYVRDFIRDNFIIEAVVSLPGDAFRRASARVKTSIIILRKKEAGDVQEDVFMTSTIYLGLEPKIAKRIGIRDKNISELKVKEIERVVAGYRSYLNGHASTEVIPFSNCSDRLDVKFCINDRGRKAKYWKSQGLHISTLGKVLNLATGRAEKVDSELIYPLLVVNYDGEVNEGEVLDGDECSYSSLYKVHEWDLLISNMGFGRGAISLVPPFHAGKFVSNEYTILTAPSKECAVFYWNLLRTKEILGDVFSSTTGMNRGRIKWDVIQNVVVPVYQTNSEISKLTSEIEEFWKAYVTFSVSKKKHIERVESELDVAGLESFERWLSFKPPE